MLVRFRHQWASCSAWAGAPAVPLVLARPRCAVLAAAPLPVSSKTASAAVPPRRAAGGAAVHVSSNADSSGGGSSSSSRRPGRGSGGSSSGRGRGSSGGGRGRGSSTRGHGRSTGSEPARVVTVWIKQAQSLEQLQQLVERHGASFDHIHTAAAITQLGQWVGSGALQARSTHPLLQQLSAQLQQQLGDCGPRQLANAVWACGKAGFADAALLDACLARLAGAAAQAEPQHLANALYSVALLREQGYSADQRQAVQLVADLVAQRQAAMPQHLSNTLWAAATLGLPLTKQQALQLVAALAEQRRAAKPQELANTLWAAATLGLPLPADSWAQLLQALAAKAADTAPQELANTLWAAAKQWGDKPERRVADALLALAAAISEQQVAGMKPREVANSLWALGTLGLCPQPLVARLVAAAAKRLPGLKPQELSNTALGLAWLGLQEAQLFGQLVTAADQQAAQWNTQDISNLAWAAAVADQRQLVARVVALCRQLAGSGAWSSTAPEELQQLHQVHLWLVTSGNSNGLAGALSPQQLAQCAAAWEESLQQRAQQRHGKFETTVYAAARRLACLADCRQEARTPDGAFSVDVAATHAPSGRLLALEADGPTHFLLPGRQVSGDTAARNRALAARGYTVVSLPYWEWDEVRGNAAAEAAWLERKIAAALASIRRGSSGSAAQQQASSKPAGAAATAARLAAGLRQQLVAGTAAEQQPAGQQQHSVRKRSRPSSGGASGHAGGIRSGGGAARARKLRGGRGAAEP